MAAGNSYCLGIKSNDFFLKDNKKAFILWLNVPKVTAYKWAENQDKCIEVLRKEDCSAWRDEFLLPKYVLEDDYESAYKLMLRVGDNNGVLTATAYRDWPIFKEIRKETKFANLFHEIFGEQLRENVNVGNEKMIHEENVANKEVQ